MTLRVGAGGRISACIALGRLDPSRENQGHYDCPLLGLGSLDTPFHLSDAHLHLGSAFGQKGQDDADT